MRLRLESEGMAENQTPTQGTAAQGPTLADLVTAVVDSYGSDIPAPMLLEVRFIGSRDVTVRLHPGGGMEPDGRVLTLPPHG